ncbi:MAG: hypothetical protein ND895_02305 [Pyrinomonadaceae bacterium]|nr:hypothetical protein [Pyrinomonadaceae bacterium]
MQKQILKGLTVLMLIGAVAMMAALVSAHAQSSSHIVADVPFEFSVGSKPLSAGEYSVRSITTNGDTVLISSRDSNEAAVRLTNSIQAGVAPAKTTLVFHRYGQRYFLSEIWISGERTGRQLLKSGQERELQNQLAATSSKSELARNSYEKVEVIAMVR